MRFAHDYLDNQEVKREKSLLPPTTYFLPAPYFKSVREADTTTPHSYLLSPISYLLLPAPSYFLPL